MPINWSSIFNPERPANGGIDWSRLGFGPDDQDELEQAKRRKLAELQRLAGQSQLIGDDAMLEAVEERRRLDGGTNLAPASSIALATQIGQRQAGEIGADESRRNWGDTLVGAAELLGREAADLPAMVVRTGASVDDWLRKKSEEGSILASAARQTPPMLIPRIARSWMDPAGVTEAARRNPEEIQRVTEETIATAPNPEVGAVLAGAGRMAGMMVDPLAGGVALATRAERGLQAAARGAERPAVDFTSRWFSKEGGLPEDIYDTLQSVKRAGEHADYTSARSIDDIGRALDEQLKSSLALEGAPSREAYEDLIKRALDGDEQAASTLPTRLFIPVKEAREKLDAASHDILKNALFSNEAAHVLTNAVKHTGDPTSVVQFIHDRRSAEKARAAFDKADWKLLENPPAGSSSLRNKPVGTNFRTKLSDYTDNLLSEMNPDKLEGILSHEDLDLWLSNSADLARGQGGNSGLLVEFDPRLIEGAVNTGKPGWEFAWDNGGAEFLSPYSVDKAARRAAIRRVTPTDSLNAARPARVRRILGILDGMVERGEAKLVDGSYVFQKYAKKPDSASLFSSSPDDFERMANGISDPSVRSAVRFGYEASKRSDDFANNLHPGLSSAADVLSAPRIGRALVPDRVIEAIQGNMAAAGEAAGEAGSTAPNLEIGAVLGGTARSIGELADLGGIAAPFTKAGQRGAKAIAKGIFPIADSLATRVKNLSTKTGGLTEEAWRILQQAKYEQEGADFVASNRIIDVNREIRHELDTTLALHAPAKKKQLEELVEKALTSGNQADWNALPPRLYKVLAPVRETMDRESFGIIENALFSRKAATDFSRVATESADPEAVSLYFRDRNAVKAAMAAHPNANYFFSLAPDDLDTALRQIPDTKIRSALRSGYESFWRADDFTKKLSPPALSSLGDLELHLDSLKPHRRAIADHYMPVLGRINRRLGTYLRTSHQAFDDPMYSKVLNANEQSDRFKNYVNFLVNVQGETPQQAHLTAKTILTEMEKHAVENAGKPSLFPDYPEAVKTALLNKKNVPQELHEFLGFNPDWRVGYQRGMVDASGIANDIKMWDDLVEADGGKNFALGPAGKGAFNAAGEELTYPVTQGTRLIAPEGMQFFTTPEYGKLLDSVSEQVRQGTLRHAIKTGNDLVRYGWIVPSAKAQSANSIANVAYSLATGDPGSMKRFFGTLKETVGRDWKMTMGEIPAAMDPQKEYLRMELARRGGMSAGGLINEDRRHLGSLLGDKAKGLRGLFTRGPERTLGVETGYTAIRDAVKEGVGTAMDLASSAFSGSDQALRENHFFAKVKQLSEAYPGWSKERVLDEAAERAKNEVPTPEYAPKFVQKARENALVGSLVTFPAELYRTTVNGVKYALKDWQKALFATDAQLAAEGADRGALMEMATKETVGLLASRGFITATAATAKYGLNKRYGHLNSGEQKDARRRFMPDYYQNSNLMPLSKGNPDEMIFMDWSPIDAFGAMGKPLMAALAAAKDPDQSKLDVALAALEEAVEPFSGVQPFAGAAIEAITGKKLMGKGVDIANPEADPLDQAESYGKHFAKTLGPAPLRTTMTMVESGQLGDKWLAEREIASMFGLRMYKFNQKDAIEYRAMDRQKSYVNMKKLRTDAVKKEFLRAGSPAVLEAEKEAQMKWATELAPEIQKDIAAAKALGYSDNQIRELFSSTAGLPKYHINAFLRGQVLPLSWKD